MNENGRFVRVKLQMKFTTADGETDSESTYQIPYFEEKVKLDIGRKIQNFFPIYNRHLFDSMPGIFDNKLIYKAATVQVIVEEVDINYVVLQSTTLENLHFFAGHRPKQFPMFTDFPIRRKYAGANFIFSYLADQVTPGDFTSGVDLGNAAGDKEVHAVLLPEGGILDEDLLKNNLGIDMLHLPNVESQAILQWLNNNLVPEWMIFSGNYKIEDDFNQVTDDFQENGQKYFTVEKQKLTVSTGFILKEEILLVKAIVRSQLAFFLLENEIYKVLPVSPKLTELERQKNLINYELEFLIVK